MQLLDDRLSMADCINCVDERLSADEMVASWHPVIQRLHDYIHNLDQITTLS
jgi:hypothetical protein